MWYLQWTQPTQRRVMGRPTDAARGPSAAISHQPITKATQQQQQRRWRWCLEVHDDTRPRRDQPYSTACANSSTASTVISYSPIKDLLFDHEQSFETNAKTQVVSKWNFVSPPPSTPILQNTKQPKKTTQLLLFDTAFFNHSFEFPSRTKCSFLTSIVHPNVAMSKRQSCSHRFKSGFSICSLPIHHIE